MDLRHVALLGLLSLATLSGCLGSDTDDTDIPETGGDETPAVMEGLFELITMPAVYTGPIGLYEPTIDVGPDGNIYVSAHSSGVGEGPSPSYFSVDDGATWESMALLLDQQAPPEEQGAAPLLSDEVFIVAAEDGTAWGLDCCGKFVTTTRPVTDEDPTGLTEFGLAVAGIVTPDSEVPLVGWCQNGAEVCYYNENAMDHTSFVTSSSAECVPYYGTDRPWLAYANGKLLMVNNPGTALIGGGEPLGDIPLQVGAMDVPPATPIAYGGAAWGIQWNLCGSSGGFIPGIPDMREDHFFAVPQWMDFRNDACGVETHYDVITGYADDVSATTQITAFYNSHVRPSETDGGPSEIGLYGQAVFDADGRLYVGAMNNTADEECMADEGGIHLAYSDDDASTFTETTFRFDRPVSSFYMDGNRYGEGFLLNWGEIDGNSTDWFMAHVFANDDGTLRLENVMLVMDDGPESSRHVQGAAMGPDGRAYAVLSWNSQNPNGATAEVGDTPMFVAVQQDGPVMPVS